MANLEVLDGQGVSKFLKVGGGSGTDLDPFVMEQVQKFNTNNSVGDAFGRVRVSNPFTIFSQKFLYSDADGTFFDTVTNGTGSTILDEDNSCIDMSVDTTGDYVIRQSRQRFNYLSGKSQLIKLTGIMTPTANVTQRIGAFQGGTFAPYDVLDGLCFESEGTTMRVRIYKNGVANMSADQGSWNIDPMDGTGPSGITVDWTKGQIFIIDYQWLGLGRVRFFLSINGVAYQVHEFNNANDVTQVYMRSPNQPVRYEIRSTGGAATLKQICCAVESEGGEQPSGLTACLKTPSTLTIGTTYQLLKAIRLRPTQLDATVLVEKINTIAISSGDYEYTIAWNPVIAGTENWTNVPGGALQEWNGDGTNNAVTPALEIDGGYNSSDTDAKTTAINSSLRLGGTIDGTPDVIALAVRTLGGTDTFRGSFTLRQLL